VATVGQNTGKVTAVGAGYTILRAEYTPAGSTDTYTAELGIYVVPRASKTEGNYNNKPNITVDLDEDPYFYGTYIFNGQSSDERLYTGISKYFTDIGKINFALRFGQDGSLSEVWCSYRQHPLTESDLVPQDFETQNKIARNLFRRSDLIGYYYNQSKPAALPE
jgi:hypothetical protein